MWNKIKSIFRFLVFWPVYLYRYFFKKPEEIREWPYVDEKTQKDGYEILVYKNHGIHLESRLSRKFRRFKPK